MYKTYCFVEPLFFPLASVHFESHSFDCLLFITIPIAMFENHSILWLFFIYVIKIFTINERWKEEIWTNFQLSFNRFSFWDPNTFLFLLFVNDENLILEEIPIYCIINIGVCLSTFIFYEMLFVHLCNVLIFYCSQ